MYDIQAIDKYAYSHLGEKRYCHTVAVAEECMRLANIFGLDASVSHKLHTAALLHDITKELDKEQNLLLCVKYNIALCDDDLDIPKALHAITGACVARDLFKIEEEVYNAIRFHTLGSKNMTLIEKLLYLADYIEPTRDFRDCIEVRRCFYGKFSSYVKKNIESMAALDDVLLYSVNLTIKTILDEGGLLHCGTVVFRNSLCKNLK